MSMSMQSFPIGISRYSNILHLFNTKVPEHLKIDEHQECNFLVMIKRIQLFRQWQK
jgi:hypothetical protein